MMLANKVAVIYGGGGAIGGRIDIVFNAIGTSNAALQGVPLVELSPPTVPVR